MKTLVTLVLLAFALFSITVHGDTYLTEAQKEHLLEKSRALGLATERGYAQNANPQREKTSTVKQQSKTVKSRQPKYLGVSNYPRTQTQSLQSIFNNADWGTPTYSNRSVQQSRKVAPTTNSNRSVQYDQRLANTAKRRNLDRQSRQIATITTTTTTKSNRSVQQSRKVSKTTKKFNWSGFFKGLGQVAEAINSGMNQTNTQLNSYIPQPGNFSPQGNSQIINTMKVGNHTLNVGGDQEIHTWDVGNQTFGTSGGKKVKMHNFGNFSTGTIGDQKVRCHMAGNIKFCK